MKLLVIGCGCCTLGVLLYAVNWLGAAINVAQVTEWDSSKGRLHAAYSLVGRQPLTIGVILLVIGAVLLVHYAFSLLNARSEARTASQWEQPADGPV